MLIAQSAKGFADTVVERLCVQSTFEGNLGLHVEEFDYYDAARFCPGKRLYGKVTYYAMRKVSLSNRRSDNLMRLYFAYVFGNAAQLANLGERAFFEVEVVPSIAQFAGRRFEDVALQFFRRLARAGRLQGVRDFGSYWYDGLATRKNGEFDCAFDRGEALDFYECKRFGRPMEESECRVEEAQVRAIPSVSIGDIGFVRTGGFGFDSGEYRLVTGG